MNRKNLLNVLDTQRTFLIIVLVTSITSLIALIYQTYLFYIEGNCGCSENTIIEIYSAIWGIPISLIGMSGVGITMVFSIYFLSNFSRENSFSEKFKGQLVRLWAIVQLISLLVVFNMMYIVYIIAEGFCELCSISQLTGIINFILVMNFYSKIK